MEDGYRVMKDPVVEPSQEAGLVSGKLRECLRCSVPDASTVVVHKAIVADAADELDTKDRRIAELEAHLDREIDKS